MHSQLGSARQEGLEDVVAVPDPGDGESLQPSIVLLPKQSQALGLRSGGAGQADGQEGMIRRGCAKAAGCLQCYLHGPHLELLLLQDGHGGKAPPCRTRNPSAAACPREGHVGT